MKKVLVVEADTVTARRMGTYWENSGYQARLVTDPSRAAFEACRFQPDLITLDTEGTGQDGCEVLRQLLSRPQTSRTPVMFLAGKESPVPSPALFPSVRVVINKPVRFQQLRAGVEKLARG